MKTIKITLKRYSVPKTEDCYIGEPQRYYKYSKRINPLTMLEKVDEKNVFLIVRNFFDSPLYQLGGYDTKRKQFYILKSISVRTMPPVISYNPKESDPDKYYVDNSKVFAWMPVNVNMLIPARKNDKSFKDTVRAVLGIVSPSKLIIGEEQI